MTFPAVAFPDVEYPTALYLEAAFTEVGEDVTVGVGVPKDWTAASKPHIQVESDGTPIILRQIVAFTTIRLTAWAAHAGRAKELAWKAQGLLCAHPGDDVIKGASPLTGVLPARDTNLSGGGSHSEIASTTSRVTVRSVPIEPTGS